MRPTSSHHRPPRCRCLRRRCAKATSPPNLPTTGLSPTSTTTTSLPFPPNFGEIPSSPAASFGAPDGAACTPTALALTWGGYVSEGDRQHSLGLDLTNTSKQTCSMIGYPGISFVNATGADLPLTYRWAGDQEVTSSVPQIVNLPARSTAYVLMNQYRCDLGDKETAATLFFIPPNTTSALELGFKRLPW